MEAGADYPLMTMSESITPYLLSFAAVCIVLCVGLKRRSVWMWYVGWALFYLFAAYFGHRFFSALYFAETSRDFIFVCLYLAGGFVCWIPAVIWWAKRRHLFGSIARASTNE